MPADSGDGNVQIAGGEGPTTRPTLPLSRYSRTGFYDCRWTKRLLFTDAWVIFEGWMYQ